MFFNFTWRFLLSCSHDRWRESGRKSQHSFYRRGSGTTYHKHNRHIRKCICHSGIFQVSPHFYQVKVIINQNVWFFSSFSRQTIQKNFHALMVSLSVFDLLYIFGSILCFSIKELNEDYRETGYYYVVPWALPMVQIGMTGSIYFTMAITVERYFTVCHPFFR